MLIINHPAKSSLFLASSPSTMKIGNATSTYRGMPISGSSGVPYRAGGQDQQQAADGQRKGQLAHPGEQHDYSKDQKCQVVDGVGTLQVIRQAPHIWMGPEPGVVKYIGTLDGHVPCPTRSNAWSGSLTVPVLLAGVEEQRVAKLQP